MHFLAPDNPLLNSPNKITLADFEGWDQERGLYFLGTFDSHYQPVLGLTDPGEPETNGSLVYAHYGKGVYIYTGLSFFRELPAGVQAPIVVRQSAEPDATYPVTRLSSAAALAPALPWPSILSLPFVAPVFRLAGVNVVFGLQRPEMRRVLWSGGVDVARCTAVLQRPCKDRVLRQGTTLVVP